MAHPYAAHMGDKVEKRRVGHIAGHKHRASGGRAKHADEKQDRALIKEMPHLLARLNEARACRYELSPDSHFIAARHPEYEGVWIVGGGSGHGFKHGPAMAERLAAAWEGGTPLPARFALGDRRPGGSLRTAGSNLSAS